MRYLILALLPIYIAAKSYGLKELIDNSTHHNEQIKSTQYKSRSKLKELDAQKSSYYPTLEIGASYNQVDPSTIVMPSETMRGFGTVSWEIYDGGRRGALVRAKEFEHQASIFEESAFSKSLTLQIINRFYTIKSLNATLESLRAESRELKAQIERVESFELAGLATNEEIDKLQAVYDDNAYLIESTKLSILTNKENLWLLSGIEAKSLKSDIFAEPRDIKYEKYEKTKVLEKSAQALHERGDAITSGYLPQLSLQDRYSISNYSGVESIPGFGGDGFLPKHQNSLTISAHMKIYDNGQLRKNREALQYQKMSLESLSIHSQREQRMNFKIAKSRLKTIRAKFKSAKSALRASKSTYSSIVKKYEVGLVDNIAYLDALKKQTISQARYRSTRYDYEVAKSIYYYYAGKDPKDYIK
ncbi:Probable outer membrane component of multidrug efflux pump [hydrothermal vent metagenome]|uniref:Probable outer membrane component of multidrug efflux pump n=1 Tax=hydrothermal vent metagenome TaxID=652676 RepID=A0A1W1CE94_9ZZZZ